MNNLSQNLRINDSMELTYQAELMKLGPTVRINDSTEFTMVMIILGSLAKILKIERIIK
jgi:hypothetical protein